MPSPHARQKSLGYFSLNAVDLEAVLEKKLFILDWGLERNLRHNRPSPLSLPAAVKLLLWTRAELNIKVSVRRLEVNFYVAGNPLDAIYRDLIQIITLIADTSELRIQLNYE